jgi:hypothetical protein
MLKYIAVFKSLSFASKVKGQFAYPRRPETIKTPKAISGGCSYSLAFSDTQLEQMKKITNKNRTGFMGIYKILDNASFEAVPDDLS